MRAFARAAALAAAVALLLACAASADNVTVDCGMRNLAMWYAHRILPHATQADLQNLADALEGGPRAVNCSVAVPKPAGRARLPAAAPRLRATPALFVDPVHGKDGNSGSQAAPLRTIQAAVYKARGLWEGRGGDIVLRAGTFYPQQPVQLDDRDSRLTIRAHDGEQVWVSGARRVDGVDWRPVAPGDMGIRSDVRGVYVAEMLKHGVTTVPGMRVDGRRMVRARFPNADPELGFGSTLATDKWDEAKTELPDQDIYPATPNRSD